MNPRAPLDFFKSVGWLANVGHFLGGYAIVLTAAFWAHASLNPVIATTWLLAIYVILKEYVVDLMWESGETVGSSTIDAIGYAAGALVAWTEVLVR